MQCHKIVLIASFIVLSSCVQYKAELEALYLQVGAEAYDRGQYGDALEWYEKAKELNDAFTVYPRLIELYLHLERYDEARELLDEHFLHDPENKLMQEFNAYWHLATERYLEAIPLYEGLLSENEYHTRALINLGFLYGKMEDFMTSYEYFQQALQLTDLEPSALKNYLQIIVALLKTEGVLEEISSDNDIYLIVDRAISSYRDGALSFDDMKEIGDQLQNIGKPHEAFSVYRTLVTEKQAGENGAALVAAAPPLKCSSLETGTEGGAAQKKKAEVYFILSNILFSNDDIKLSDPFQQGLNYLEAALEHCYGREASEQSNLIALLTQTRTVVLFERVNTLYLRYSIVVPEDVSFVGGNVGGE